MWIWWIVSCIQKQEFINYFLTFCICVFRVCSIFLKKLLLLYFIYVSIFLTKENKIKQNKTKQKTNKPDVIIIISSNVPKWNLWLTEVHCIMSMSFYSKDHQKKITPSNCKNGHLKNKIFQNVHFLHVQKFIVYYEVEISQIR